MSSRKKKVSRVLSQALASVKVVADPVAYAEELLKEGHRRAELEFRLNLQKSIDSMLTVEAYGSFYDPPKGWAVVLHTMGMRLSLMNYNTEGDPTSRARDAADKARAYVAEQLTNRIANRL